MEPLVSIVIPCFNEELYIQDCIISLLDGAYQKIEIIVVDGESTDRTLEILECLKQTYNNISVLSNPRRVTPVSLNIGVGAATGSYIMIAGAHSKYPTNYISELMLLQKTIDCDVIGGAIETRVKNENLKSNAIVRVLSDKFGVGNSSFRTESNVVLQVDTVPFGIYKRAVFEKVGGYNEALIRNHDIELSKRIARSGFKIILVSHIRCIYYAREDFAAFAKNNFANGYWNVLTLYITRDFKSLSIRHYVPLVFVLSIFFPIPLAVLFCYSLFLVPIVLIIIYFAFLLYMSLKLMHVRSSFFYILVAFTTLHFSYGLGSLFALFRLDKIKE